MQTTRGTSLSGTHTGDDARPSGSRRLIGALLAVAGVVWVVDQVAKITAVRELSDRAPIELLGGALTLRLVRNPGAAFGIAGGGTVFFTLVAVVVAVVILRVARRLGSGWWALALGLMLGGALGNLTDRMVRDPAPLRGHVVDFLELPHWPVFNVADMAIVGGSALMVLLSFRGVPFDRRSLDEVPVSARPPDPAAPEADRA
jgi:lipoprotein signal peptidase